jgi:outer membrane immunogenic protein
MKKLQLAAVAVALVSVNGAFAADMPVKPVYKAPPPAPVFSWTGFYVGANVGFGGDQFRYPFDVPVVPISGEASLNSSGFFGGGQIGYNYQIANWVIGIEADLQKSDISGHLDASVGPVSLSAGSDLDWFGTVRGRLGFVAWDRLLIYGTGGWAYGRTSTNLDVSGFGGAFSFSEDHSKSGWTAGAGLEYAVTNNLSIKGEYMYLDLGRDNIFTSPGIFSIDEETTAHSFRLGANWHFGGL